MSLQSRKATEGDIGFILGLYEKSGFSYAWESSGRKFDMGYVGDSIRSALSRDSVEIITEVGKDVGCIWYGKRKDHFGNDYGNIEIMLVDNGHHGKGIGTDLIKCATERFRSAGVHDVRLLVLGANGRARDLYKRLGFEDFAHVMRKTV